MGWTWEVDGLGSSFHGLNVGVGRFEVEVPWVPWVVCESPTF